MTSRACEGARFIVLWLGKLGFPWPALASLRQSLGQGSLVNLGLTESTLHRSAAAEEASLAGP